MYILFEDAGKYLTGQQLSATDASSQVELVSGKRIKVKQTHVLLKFTQPTPAELAQEAKQQAQEIDLDLVWEFAPQDEFSFIDLALEYFGDQSTDVQKATMAYCLFAAPHYFRRMGKGKFKKATAQVLEQALAAIAKKQQILDMIEQWSIQLVNGQCPAQIQQQRYKILFKPDKNSTEYKAVSAASQISKKSPLTLLCDCGIINSTFEFHWQRFILDNYPKGWQFPENLTLLKTEQQLSQATVKAYSIDDAGTTEIDDALSLQGIGSGELVLGIHIAVPALGLPVDSDWDKVAYERMSTMYMPGYKITMLADEVVKKYSLDANGHRPALSLYVSFDESTLAVKNTSTKLEQVWIERNVRLHELTEIDNQQWFEQDNSTPIADLPISKTDLLTYYKIATTLKAQRIDQRGKPEQNNRQDYSFNLSNSAGELPKGDEQVEIGIRARGAPIDLIVSEIMILANKTWGQLLSDCSVPAIYRYQMSLQPGMRVRMGTKALPHAGMGVDCYAWCTSPLRRYVDLINQQQLLACYLNGATAALVAPFKPKDARLFAIISAFEATYGAYSDFQKQIEKYWTLRYIEQKNLYEQDCEVLTEGENSSYIARCQQLPLVLKVIGTPILPKPVRGTVLKIKIDQINLITLEATASFIELLSQQQQIDIVEDPEEDLSLNAVSLPLAIDELLQDEQNETEKVE